MDITIAWNKRKNGTLPPQNKRQTATLETCTAARNAGRTRLEQIRWELANPNVDENPPCCETCGMFTSQCQCWDAVNGI